MCQARGMIWTSGISCFASDASTLSAGGQLEQPSEVKSSTTTGAVAGDGAASAKPRAAKSETIIVAASETFSVIGASNSFYDDAKLDVVAARFARSCPARRRSGSIPPHVAVLVRHVWAA